MRTALLLALTLSPAVAVAAPAAEKAPPATTSKKAKAGEACKSSADCDQSGLPQSCSSGRCQANPAPLPPT